MIPGIYNFEPHYRGDTFDGIEFTIRDYYTKVVVDLSGATVKCQFRKGSVVLEITDGVGITVTDAVNGVIEIDEILEVDWLPGEYKYDVEVVFASGRKKTYIVGILEIIQDSTRG